MITREDVPQIMSDFIYLTKPYNEVNAEVANIPDSYQWQVDLAIVTRQALILMLERYLAKMVTTELIEDWSGTILGSPFTDYEPGYSQVISDVLDRLTEAGDYLTISTADECIHDLNNASFDITDID